MSHEHCPACGRCKECGHGPGMPVWTYPWWQTWPSQPPQLQPTVTYHAPSAFLACSKERPS